MNRKEELERLLRLKTDIRAQIRKRAHDQIQKLNIEIAELEKEIEREKESAPLLAR